MEVSEITEALDFLFSELEFAPKDDKHLIADIKADIKMIVSQNERSIPANYLEKAKALTTK